MPLSKFIKIPFVQDLLIVNVAIFLIPQEFYPLLSFIFIPYIGGARRGWRPLLSKLGSSLDEMRETLFDEAGYYFSKMVRWSKRRYKKRRYRTRHLINCLLGREALPMGQEIELDSEFFTLQERNNIQYPFSEKLHMTYSLYAFLFSSKIFPSMRSNRLIYYELFNDYQHSVKRTFKENGFVIYSPFHYNSDSFLRLSEEVASRSHLKIRELDIFLDAIEKTFIYKIYRYPYTKDVPFRYRGKLYVRHAMFLNGKGYYLPLTHHESPHSLYYIIKDAKVDKLISHLAKDLTKNPPSPKIFLS